METSMVNSYLCIWLLLIVGYAEHVGSWKSCPHSETSCGSLPVRFPFRIIGRQPEECGYPGFALECSPSNLTLLELPRSVKIYIKSIDYRSQTIDLYDPSRCLSKQLENLSISASPFQFIETYLYDYTFFNCSSQKDRPLNEVPCLSSSIHKVYAISNDSEIRYYPLTFCSKIFTITSLPSNLFYEDITLHLMWPLPMCRDCETKGKRCGFKNSTTNYETACFEDRHEGSSTKLLLTGSILGSLLLLVVTIATIYYICSSQKSRKENQAIIEKFLKDYKAFKPTRYSYAEIKRITNQFSDKLGQGSFGTVFKGKISTQFIVAVKILANSEGNGEEFINEVRTIGKIHHVNIVRLIGFCADGFRRALVYEFLPNGSLQNFINSPDNQQNFVGWEKLHEIALGITKGIEYLHQGCEQRILHFDIKPHNVLLDHDFTPKICDFGLAKLCSKDQSIVSMTTARGTLGYIAPEVFSRNFGNVSHKSDVYSFGMLLLETIGGRKITEDTDENTCHIYYPEWIYNILEEKQDARIQIEEEGDDRIAKMLAKVGLWCIQWHAVDRPSMQVVVQMLEGQEDKLPIPPNPFSFEGHLTRKRASVPGRHMMHVLEIIHEVE